MAEAVIVATARTPIGRANRPEGGSGNNVARVAALRAGLPVSVAGVTMDRKCASGLQAIAFAAQRVLAGEEVAAWAWPRCSSRHCRPRAR